MMTSEGKLNFQTITLTQNLQHTAEQHTQTGIHMKIQNLTEKVTMDITDNLLQYSQPLEYH